MIEQDTEAKALSDESAERTRGGQAFLARADIYETKDNLTLLMEMPGVASDSVNVTLDKQALTVTGQKKSHAPNDFVLTHAEFQDGEYERSFTISEMVDGERISASMKNGMLEVTLPKTPKAEARRIPVRTA